MQTTAALESEIYAQPEVLAQMLVSQLPVARDIVAALRDYAPTHIAIAARGSSDNVARYGKYVLSAFGAYSVALAAPSLYTLYHSPPDLSRAAVLGISQSGQSPDIVAVVSAARAQGALTIALTNSPNSPLADATEWALDIQAGPERSVPATKTYTAQVAALALMAALLSDQDERLAELNRVPEWAAGALRANASARVAAAAFGEVQRCAIIGRGYNLATAHEVALKLKEMCYITAEPYSTADFLHGPIAMVEQDFPVVAVAPQGAARNDVGELVQRLVERGAKVVTISDDSRGLNLGQLNLPMPEGIPEWLSPILAIIPGQLLALHLSLLRGLDPDRPRGLQKITRTL